MISPDIMRRTPRTSSSPYRGGNHVHSRCLHSHTVHRELPDRSVLFLGGQEYEVGFMNLSTNIRATAQDAKSFIAYMVVCGWESVTNGPYTHFRKNGETDIGYEVVIFDDGEAFIRIRAKE